MAIHWSECPYNKTLNDYICIGTMLHKGVDEHTEVYSINNQNQILSNEITGIIYRGFHTRFIKVTTKSGIYTMLTPDHKIYLSDGKYVTANKLSYFLRSEKTVSLSGVEIVEASEFKYKKRQQTYDLQVADHTANNFRTKSGLYLAGGYNSQEESLPEAELLRVA